MVPIRTILCPVDFSETSEHALTYALDLAARLDARLDVVHAYQLPVYALPDGSVFAGPELASRIMDRAQTQLDELVRRNAGRGVEIGSHITEGAPHVEIGRVARERGADLIVMGTHGHGGLRHLLLGSVAERVVRTSEIPVLTVRHPAQGRRAATG